MISSVVNTAGESERESRSRRWNAVEALGVAAASLFLAWPVALGWGLFGANHVADQAAKAGLYLLLGFALCVSPFLHRDQAESWGLGNPRRLWRMLRSGPLARRILLALAVLGITGGCLWLMLAHWPFVARRLGLPKGALDWPGSVPGILLILAAGSAVGLFLATCAIRYDNFGPAFLAALKVSLVLVLFALAIGWTFRGWTFGNRFKPAQYALDVIAYFFWGYLQQLFFCAWFGTRLRKGLGPSSVPALEGSLRGHWLPAAKGGLIASVVLGAGGWLALGAARGGAMWSTLLLLRFMAVAFPVGAVWGWFWGRDRRRLLVATLSASFFALIHLDSYGLVLATWLMGIFLAWMFMADRTRNIAALGFIHGFLGTTFNLVLGKSDAGVFRVSYRVGPWNVRHPGPEDLVVPLICLAVYAGLALWCWRRLSDRPGPPARSLLKPGLGQASMGH
jgi:hypothetical protein